MLPACSLHAHAQVTSAPCVCCQFERPVGTSAASSQQTAERCSLSRLRLQGTVLAVAEEAGEHPDGTSSHSSYELTEQHARPARSYIVLTTDGCQRLRKRRPVDELLQAAAATLPAAHAGLASPVEAFFLR